MSGPRLDWLSLDASAFRRPRHASQIDIVSAHGIELACLDPSPLTRENLFEVRFDEVLARLTALPRMDAEPDGFFVRTGAEGGHTWKLNGHLFELEDWLWRMDLHGECPPDALDEVLAAVGWPAVGVVFQLVRLGVTVGEADGRRWSSLEWAKAAEERPR